MNLFIIKILFKRVIVPKIINVSTLMIPVVGTGRAQAWQLVKFWTVKVMITVSDFDLTTHPLTMAPRPLPRHSDSWTLVLVSLLVWSLQLQTADCCHIFCPCLLSIYHFLMYTTLQYALHTTICIKSEGKYTKEWRFQEKNLLPLSFSLLWVMSILLFKKKHPSPSSFLPPFVLPSPLLSLAPSRQLWSAQKLIFRVLTTMFFLLTAGFHLQSTGGQYLG